MGSDVSILSVLSVEWELQSTMAVSGSNWLLQFCQQVNVANSRTLHVIGKTMFT
jgi:hypothetical protein